MMIHSRLRSRELVLWFMDFHEKDKLNLQAASTSQLHDLDAAIQVADFGNASKSLNSLRIAVIAELQVRGELEKSS